MKHEHKPKNHGWWMAAGCVAMLIGVLALSTTGTGVASYGYLMILLCPIMHLVMHKRMHGTHGSLDGEAPHRLPPASDETDQG